MNFDESGQVIHRSLQNALLSVPPGETTTSVDGQDSDWVEFVIQAGSAIDGTITATLVDSDDDVTFTAVSGVSTVTLTADKDMRSIIVRTRAVRRYIALDIEKAVAAGATRGHVTSRQWGNVRSGSNFPTVSFVA